MQILHIFLENYIWYISEACKSLHKSTDVELVIWCSISEKIYLKAIEGTVE
ncbi:hypothetical protein [Terrisporobacter mayombei]|uniref:hypothetical protein n=1 Tax=Terrisporobacter mayombei TaxID=1541 RepID=UPI003A7F3A47